MLNLYGRPLRQMEPVMAPFKSQKREFSSLNLSNVAIVPGKSFKNPNFVNDYSRNVQSPYKCSPQFRNNCQNSDTPFNVTEKHQPENNTNSSHNFVQETEKESPSRKFPVESSPMCYSRKRCKKVKRSKKKKVPNKSSKHNTSRRQVFDMMEIDLEPDISMTGCESNMSLGSPKSVHLADFIADIPDLPTKRTDELFTVISISPPNNTRVCPRERDLSICESEDSFIVFDSGTDEELKFSDSDDNIELDSDDDSTTDSDIDDDFDSSFSVVPCKRVRFADNEELCEIHPMVQWSFAYRNARKGPWEEYARDRERFHKRICQTEEILRPVFDQRHRENIYRERFE